MQHRLIIPLICLSLGMVHCGDHDHDHENNDHNNHSHNNGKETPQEEGCEHMKDGPNEAIAASADATSPVEATKEHTRYDVTLTDLATDKGGVVRLVVGEAGDHYLFLNKDIPTTLTKVGGDAITPKTDGGALSECSSDIPKFKLFTLEVGSYDLSFGPTTETEVRFVFE